MQYVAGVTKGEMEGKKERRGGEGLWKSVGVYLGKGEINQVLQLAW